MAYFIVRSKALSCTAILHYLTHDTIQYNTKKEFKWTIKVNVIS